MALGTFYRLRCGHRVWSPWLDSEDKAWSAAVDVGLASRRKGRVFPGPLVWIEKGYRQYAKRRTEPMAVELDGQPLERRFHNPMA